MKWYTLLLIAFFCLTACNSRDKKTSDTLANSIEKGGLIYQDFCVSCHMANGEGVPKAFPPLANSDYLKSKREASIRAIKYGQNGEIVVNGVTYKGTMAALGLTNEEVANVMNYISNNWGNKNETLATSEEVSKIQPKK